MRGHLFDTFLGMHNAALFNFGEFLIIECCVLVSRALFIVFCGIFPKMASIN
jgi:hypothetical protein